ncbi:hypothetical protein GCM10010984_22450 [Chishuiella changwenlii]|uniref:Uncharacterized protein n=2 Tax=Chishuiella changwenlii TaxID=1434701 RepID=A0ABQ1TVC3_9FLAO|nr:hypothetical protein [Chishuiella changwenlii]GGF04678.1 hypothetical protein GCM10010984_22450 [Chishuiella changwenlii]
MNKLNLMFLLFANVLFAQIAIDSVGVDIQTIVDVTSHNKTVLLPRIEGIKDETDLSFLKEDNKNEVPIGLLVYNKSTRPSSLEKGYYYWSNDKWNLLIDDQSVYSRFTIDKVNNTQTTSPVFIKKFFSKEVPFPVAEFDDFVTTLGGLHWVELEGLDYTFEIENNYHNNVFVKVSGSAQYASSTFENLIFGMNIGVFLQRIDEDGTEGRFRLQGISTINRDNIRNSNCFLFNYAIQSVIGKLEPGKYRIKSYVSGNRNYNNEIEIVDKWITLGGKSITDNNSSNADCTNSSNDQLIGRQTVVISESEN